MLKNVIFSSYCQVGAFDARGQQVDSQQMVANYRVLLQMEAEGVLSDDTIVDIPPYHRRVRYADLKEKEPFGFYRAAAEKAPEGGEAIGDETLRDAFRRRL